MFPKIVVSQNRWCIMEKPIKMDDLGVPLFSETSIHVERYVWHPLVFIYIYKPPCVSPLFSSKGDTGGSTRASSWPSTPMTPFADREDPHSKALPALKLTEGTVSPARKGWKAPVLAVQQPPWKRFFLPEEIHVFYIYLYIIGRGHEQKPAFLEDHLRTWIRG